MEPELPNTKIVLITNGNVDCKIDRIDVVPSPNGRTFNVFLDVLGPSQDSKIGTRKIGNTVSAQDIRTKLNSKFCEIRNSVESEIINFGSTKLNSTHPHLRRKQQQYNQIGSKSNKAGLSPDDVPRRLVMYGCSPRLLELAKPKKVWSHCCLSDVSMNPMHKHHPSLMHRDLPKRLSVEK